jgi:hypothetical protein
MTDMYRCEYAPCPFEYLDRCVYWGSTIEYMKSHGVKCKMTHSLAVEINNLMEGVIEQCANYELCK